MTLSLHRRIVCHSLVALCLAEVACGGAAHRTTGDASVSQDARPDSASSAVDSATVDSGGGSDAAAPRDATLSEASADALAPSGDSGPAGDSGPSGDSEPAADSAPGDSGPAADSAPAGDSGPAADSAPGDSGPAADSAPAADSGGDSGDASGDAGSACPGAPAEAVAAGFTTCARNFDFSETLYATAANWLDCTGTADPSLPWHAGVPGLIPQNVGGPPCSGNVTVASDAVAGKNVLQLRWLQSFATTYACASKGIGCSVSIQTATGGANGINPGDVLSAGFPIGIFVETMVRISTTYTSTPSFLDDSAVWLWQMPGTGTFTSGQAAIENDVVELTASGGGYGVDGVHNWGANDYTYSTWTSYGSNNTHVPAGWSPTAYHKYGYLMTSDGATHIYACEWIDDEFQSCGDSDAQTFQYTDRNFLVATLQGGGLSGGYALSDITEYVEYIRVWSCAGWASGQCNGATLMSGPPPALTYWH